MRRLTVLLLLSLLFLATCCPWAEWQPCQVQVVVEDADGQPLDATVVILKAVSREEFSKTDCPGGCFIEVTDLFHNGKWSSGDGLILRVESAGKQAQEKTGTCQHYGMNIAEQDEPGTIVFELTDLP